MVVSFGTDFAAFFFGFIFFILFSGVGILGVYSWLGKKIRKLYEIPLLGFVYDYFSRFDRCVFGIGVLVVVTFAYLLIPVVYRGIAEWFMVFVGDVVVK